MNSRTPVLLVLIAVSVVVYLAAWLFGRPAVYAPLFISQYIQPGLPEIGDGEAWRLVTPIFLHFSFAHLAFNALAMWVIGQPIEARQGSVVLLWLTAIIAVSSNLAQYYFDGPSFGGLSGVVYGYFGYAWIQGTFNPRFGMRLMPQMVYLLLGWFVVCWSGVLKIFGMQVANVAHTGGLLSGIALAFLAIAGTRARIR